MAVSFHIVGCVCGKRLVSLVRKSSRSVLGPKLGAAFVVYGGVCEGCGRGADLRIERKPGSEVRRG